MSGEKEQQAANPIEEAVVHVEHDVVAPPVDELQQRRRERQEQHDGTGADEPVSRSL
jgi:hypothetical protein